MRTQNGKKNKMVEKLEQINVLQERILLFHMPQLNLNNIGFLVILAS